jgi:Fe2+ transport system protein FeoA
MPTTLDQVRENQKAKVIDIQGGQGIRQRLGQMSGLLAHSH